MAKSSYHHKNLKEAMIKNSIKIIGEEGYGKFSMRKVARACGVSHAAPYRHFKDKDSLVAAIFNQINEKFDHVLHAALKKYPDDSKDQLREMAFLYVKFFTENPEYMKFLFFSDLNKILKAQNGPQSMVESTKPYQTFIKTVEHCQSLGGAGARLKDRDALVLSVWGLAHGIAVLTTQGYFTCTEDCLSLVHRILWEGECIP